MGSMPTFVLATMLIVFICPMYEGKFRTAMTNHRVRRNFGLDDPARRVKRQSSNDTLIMETLVILDEDYIERKSAIGFTTDEQLEDLVYLKWMGIQAELGRPDVFTHYIQIDIKKIEYWHTNPKWYPTSSKNMAKLVKSVCKRAKNPSTFGAVFDLVHILTGIEFSKRDGYAHFSGICKPGANCVMTEVHTDESFFMAVHEIGRSFGLKDTYHKCAEDEGNMISNSFGWTACDSKKFEGLNNKKSSPYQCLKTVDVPSEALFNLPPVWPGMLLSADEICYYKYGPGFHFREFPVKKNVWSECTLYSCINLDPKSATYGLSYLEKSPTDGRSCGVNQVCTSDALAAKESSNNFFPCIFLNDTGLRLNGVEEVKGDWSPFSNMMNCSHSCGTGVRFQQRFCNNPKPQLSENCAGEEFYAELCNTQSCSSTFWQRSDMVEKSAGKECSRWKNDSLFEMTGLKSENYLNTGKSLVQMYPSSYLSGDGHCEVQCDSAANYSASLFERHGLLPDGTWCIPSNATSKDRSIRGMTGACIQGHCLLFGCHGASERLERDDCGVCGGDNTTCSLTSGVFTEVTKKGKMKTFLKLNPGTRDIYCSFNWTAMPNHYLMAKEMGKPFSITPFKSYNTVDRPAFFANTTWYFHFKDESDDQFLYAPGPVNSTVIIKLLRAGTQPNVGVYYQYNL